MTEANNDFQRLVVGGVAFEADKLRVVCVALAFPKEGPPPWRVTPPEVIALEFIRTALEAGKRAKDPQPAAGKVIFDAEKFRRVCCCLISRDKVHPWAVNQAEGFARGFVRMLNEVEAGKRNLATDGH